MCSHTEIPGTTKGNSVPVQSEKIDREDKDQTPEMGARVWYGYFGKYFSLQQAQTTVAARQENCQQAQICQEAAGQHVGGSRVSWWKSSLEPCGRHWVVPTCSQVSSSHHLFLHSMHWVVSTKGKVQPGKGFHTLVTLGKLSPPSDSPTLASLFEPRR